MKLKEKIINDMCMTFDHRYYNEVPEEDVENVFARMSGMTKAERQHLYRSMKQIFENDIEPKVMLKYPVNNRLLELHNQQLLPQDHVNYLKRIQPVKPKVIYDIGACVLHWTNRAKEVWPDAKFVLFEAMDEVEFLYQGYDYELGVFSDVSGKEIEFYQNVDNPGGNSYYRENPEFSWGADKFFTNNHRRKVKTKSIDDVVAERYFPLPDMVKIDVQGCELDILKGMTNTLKNCKDLIIEMQRVQYNLGAPLVHETKEYIESLGFVLIGDRFSNSHPDAPDSDYHFRKF